MASIVHLACRRLTLVRVLYDGHLVLDPAQRIYDSRVEGRCIIEPVPWAIFLGCFCVKMVIVGISLSFGIFALRYVELSELSSFRI
ncbi:hypothetical protein VDGE_30308 [Verticillium dahliae]|uniref:Uncharacterized protein n=1 Tax=Verticillium dahliae TaxID=27337 RepID=A0A444RWI8_VERDA|nr:hypothetical protein VDGE_30308 [Verticillium dahliae]